MTVDIWKIRQFRFDHYVGVNKRLAGRILVWLREDIVRVSRCKFPPFDSGHLHRSHSSRILDLIRRQQDE
jgi:hypothetical protein